MRFLASLVAPASVLCCALAPAFAWNDHGHMIIARLAYAQLSPAAKARADTLLAAHPQHALLLDKCPLETDKNLWVFMRAATWPDMVRDRANPLHKSDHHSPWHYINYPIDRDGVKGPTPDPAWKPGTDPANILQALAKCEGDLKDAALDDAAKGKALAWYLHLVGDLHQPLHATALFSAEYPEGDRGGNLMIVEHAGKVSRLHALWDGILGADEIGASVDAWAKQREANAAFAREALAPELTKIAYTDWAMESVELATSVAYSNGALKATKPAPNGTLPTAAPALPADYIEKGARVAEKRVVLAGHRLADKLGACLAPPVAASPPVVAPAPAPAPK